MEKRHTANRNKQDFLLHPDKLLISVKGWRKRTVRVKIAFRTARMEGLDLCSGPSLNSLNID